jgi:hypothetical protein
VAIALRNRWRRQQVDEKLRHEITPKNILMIGPTGVGKTEIARRLAKLADAPFIKVEATKFTEVGYVGKDVDSIIRDLAEMAVKQTRVAEMRKVRARAEDAAEDRILDVLMPPARGADGSTSATALDSPARQVFRKKLREHQLDDKEIEIDLAEPRSSWRSWARRHGGNDRAVARHVQPMGGGKRKTRKLKIAEAMKLLVDEEAAKLVNEDEIRARPLPTPSRTASSSSTRSTRSPRAAKRRAPRCRARACSATCCRWWRAPPCPPSTAGQDRPHPVHRQRRVPPEQAQRPDSRAAGALPDPRRAAVAVGAGLRSHPHADPRVAGQAVPGAAGHRGRDAGIHARRHHAAGAASPST